MTASVPKASNMKTTVVSSSGKVIEESEPSKVLGVPVWAQFKYLGGRDRVEFDIELHSHHGSVKSSWGCGSAHIVDTYRLSVDVKDALVGILNNGWFPTSYDGGCPKELLKLPDHSALRKVRFFGRDYVGPPSVEHIVKNLVHDAAYFQEHSSEADFIVSNLPQERYKIVKHSDMVASVQKSIDTWRGASVVYAWLIGTLGHRNFASIAEEEID